ncbi:hypothetical protein Pan241w_42930 [Gimesia alba]|uniref:Uncharacterized protein n=1 Tax=Gimesia alba TaxID=2527973 RepID=A0A517RJX5_9PLAN|nr:hypothetical protein [Gimesia alba]QDT44185.1 hypothetical protein Pan241w_42930 [Gimesia alba]
MARNEQDREDLMREATALFPRAELQLAHEAFPLFWGQKQSGHFSFYFGSDPVYQFDQDGFLRRAYLEGALYRTQGNTLARLTRVRNSEESILNRYDLSITEVESLLQTMAERFRRLESTLLEDSGVQTIQTLPENAERELCDQIQAHVQLVLQHSDQLAPRIRGKR